MFTDSYSFDKYEDPPLVPYEYGCACFTSDADTFLYSFEYFGPGFMLAWLFFFVQYNLFMVFIVYKLVSIDYNIDRVSCGIEVDGQKIYVVEELV
jgi:hypothetical protein